MASRFVPIKSGMDQLLRSPSGPVGRHVARMTRQVAIGARQRVGVKTGATRNSIHDRLGIGPTGLVGRVTARSVAALFHHEGTRPHTIRATKAHGLLVFEVQGSTVFTRKPVRHPGTKANAYLVDAALAAGLKVRRVKG